MNTSKTLHYKDYSGTWHVCPLQKIGVRGYVLPKVIPNVVALLASNSIFLAKLDIPDQWYIPDIAKNTERLEQLVEQQREAFEAEVKAYYPDCIYNEVIRILTNVQ